MFNHYSGKKVVITGHTGFKGAWLTAWLIELGADVIGISHDIPTNPSLFEVLNLESKIKHHLHDLRDNEKTTKLIKETQPDFIFHLAAQPIVKKAYADPVSTYSTNVMGTIHILEALRQLNQPIIAIFITSDKCYENVEWTWGYRENDRLGGKDPYSASKSCAEHAIYSYFHSFFNTPNCPVKLISTRAGNVIGGGDWGDRRIVPDCFKAWSTNKPVEICNPQSTRPWQHVLEPLRGYLTAGSTMAAGKNITGESFNFGPPENQNSTVETLISALAKHWHSEEIEPKYRVLETQTFNESRLLKLCCDKAFHTLGYKPALSFDQTIQFTAEWYNMFYNKNIDPFTFTRDQIQSYMNCVTPKEFAVVN